MLKGRWLSNNAVRRTLIKSSAIDADYVAIPMDCVESASAVVRNPSTS